MEELTKQTFENTVVEAIESTEVLDEVVNEKSGNIAVIAVAIGVTVAAGIYGFKKFTNWRKNKKLKKWMHTDLDEYDVLNVNTEMESDEDLI